jgi:hypothetical protein
MELFPISIKGKLNILFKISNLQNFIYYQITWFYATSQKLFLVFLFSPFTIWCLFLVFECSLKSSFGNPELKNRVDTSVLSFKLSCTVLISCYDIGQQEIDWVLIARRERYKLFIIQIRIRVGKKCSFHWFIHDSLKAGLQRALFLHSFKDKTKIWMID